MLVPALVLIALALPSSASAQATRTWVSGVGDDANPCSRTAPCKTFAGAISKTANGGEINCLDPGGFGGVTITKSLTIKCHYTEGGVLVSGTNAIVINATATDTVTLRGLDINGIGTGAQTSLSGIKVLSANKVNIYDNEIYRFRAGVVVAPTSANTRVV
jgi:nitrous oxidase accessory protein NosD